MKVKVEERRTPEREVERKYARMWGRSSVRCTCTTGKFLGLRGRCQLKVLGASFCRTNRVFINVSELTRSQERSLKGCGVVITGPRAVGGVPQLGGRKIRQELALL